MYLDANDNKIKLQPEKGDLEYLIDAYIELDGTIADGKDSSELKEEICEYVCSNFLCRGIRCSECPFNIPPMLKLKTLELVVQEEFEIFN